MCKVYEHPPLVLSEGMKLFAVNAGYRVDGCWCCKNRHNCNQCKEVRKYRKQHFPPKEKSRHGKADHDDRGE